MQLFKRLWCVLINLLSSCLKKIRYFRPYNVLPSPFSHSNHINEIFLKGFLVRPIVRLTTNPSRRIISVIWMTKRTRVKPVWVWKKDGHAINMHSRLMHGRLYRWTENSFPFFLFLKPVEISKKCFNITWTSLKVV